LTGTFNLIRELLSSTDKVISIFQHRGFLKITLSGFVQITSPFLEEMKESGFVFKGIRILIDRHSVPHNIEIDISDDSNVPTFVWTIIVFQDTEFKDRELPPAPQIKHSEFAVDLNEREQSEFGGKFSNSRPSEQSTWKH
jgi:hypothetical protein